MTFSVIIPALNEEKRIGSCIESILDSTRLPHEIIVVDNGSTDATAKVARSFPEVRVIKEERRGTNRARDTGWRAADGEILCFFDADCRIAPDWLARAERHFRAYPVKAVTGEHRFYDAGRFANFLSASTFSVIRAVHCVTPVIGGWSYAVRREVMREISADIANLEFWGDDSAAAKRIAKYGEIVFDPYLRVTTSARRFSGEGYVRTTWRYARSHCHAYFKSPPITETYTELR